MATHTLLTVDLRREDDVVLARQRARQLAAEFKLDPQDQIRFATAVSEIVRNAHQYATGGKVEFQIDAGPPAILLARIADRGRGIARLKEVMEGRYVSSTGLGLGVMGARRLSDTFSLQSTPETGTEIILGKRVPAAIRVTPGMVSAAMAAVAAHGTPDSAAELHQQNQELLRVLERASSRPARRDRRLRTPAGRVHSRREDAITVQPGQRHARYDDEASQNAKRREQTAHQASSGRTSLD